MAFRPTCKAILTGCAIACCINLACPALALQPQEIAVLYRNNDAQSRQVADYYAQARAIPSQNLIGITCDHEMVPAAAYRNSIVPQVCAGLANSHLTTTVKCLVSVYGMPLTVGPEEIGAPQRAEVDSDQHILDATLKKLADAITDYDHIGANPTTLPAKSPAKALATPEWGELIHQLTTAINAAGHRVEALTGPERAHGFLQMEQMQRTVAGYAGILASFHVRPDAADDDPGRLRMQALSTQLKTIDEQVADLRKQPPSAPIRDRQIDLELRAHGLIGQAEILMSIIQQLSPQETESCFDNELALVLDDQSYPRYRWLPNPKNVEIYPMARRLLAAGPSKEFPEPLMAVRLDGLTADAVMRMIDTTLAVEKTGLDGTLYLDARGLHGSDPYSIYDADIRATADWIRANSTMPVVLDDTPGFFQAKNCPDAALYCGWYSLRHYLDSCQWVPGAVGYHVASFEMVHLHNQQETGWVINLLKRGFCGTLGPTAEPYLTAFPKPSQFFPLLLCGEFTQGEVWEVTAPMTSWRMGFVGDPLYNPFKHHPRVTVETIKADPILRNAFTILRGSPSAP